MRKVNYTCDLCRKKIEPKEELVNRKYQMFRVFDSTIADPSSLDGSLVDLCDDCYGSLLVFLSERRRTKNVDTNAEQTENSEQ